MPLIHWTIRLALIAFAACFWGWGTSSDWIRSKTGRAVWTFGCLAFLSHLAAAFLIFHHGSHQHALEHTARETERILGISFGEGIYFSYLFALVWVFDVGWWWLSEQSYLQRALWIQRLILKYLFFIAFNGAIVFEEGPTRVVAIVVFVLLMAGALWTRWSRAREKPPEENTPESALETKLP